MYDMMIDYLLHMHGSLQKLDGEEARIADYFDVIAGQGRAPGVS
jgi:hypothetical protein